MAPITCDVVRPGELEDDHRARWEKLRSGVPALESPFLSATFAQQVGAVRSDARVAVLRPEGDASGEPAGFLAFQTSPTRYGRPIGRSMSKSKLFPPMSVHLISSGESSGELDNMLERAATNQERELDAMMGALVGLLGPLLIVVMGLFVMGIVFAMLMPIFEMNNLIR